MVLESVNCLHQDDMATLREILEDQKITVTMSQKGVANARVRLILTMNPPKNLNQYLTKCGGIIDTYAFKNEPDVTRIDVFLAFATEDVSLTEIINRKWCTDSPAKGRLEENGEDI